MQKFKDKFCNINFMKLAFYTTMLLFITALCTTAKYVDHDLWARLIVGKAFWQSGEVLKQDFLSYIPTHLWYDHEWGSGVVFYAIYKIFSFYGFTLLQILLNFFTFLFAIKTMNLNRIDKEYNILFFIFAISALYDFTNVPVRCQNFSFLFFTIYIYIFELARKGKTKYLWLTPILMLFWNNLHGGCVSGLGLFVLYIVGEIFNKNKIKPFLLAFLANILVLPINPWGFSYLKFLFHAISLDRTWIVEWYGLFNPIVFGYTYYIIKTFILIMIFFIVCTLVYSLKKRNIDCTKYVVTCISILLGVNHVKHLPFAIITITIFFYKDIYSLINLVTKNIFKKEKVSFCKNILIYTSLTAYIIFTFHNYNFKPFMIGYPYQSVEFIKRNNLQGNLLCDYTTGSYLGYKLYPQNKIYMDGRYEEVFYTEDFYMLMDFLYSKEYYTVLLNKYPPDIILIRDGYTVLNNLLYSGYWTIVFKENDFLTLVKTKNLKRKYVPPPEDIEYYEKTFFDTDISFMLQSKDDIKRK